MNDFEVISLLLMAISISLSYKLAGKWIEIQEKKSKFQYKIQRLKYTEQDDEEEADNSIEEALPTWLSAAAKAAGISVKKLSEGDINEVQKVIPILQKVVSVAGSKGISAGQIKY